MRRLSNLSRSLSSVRWSACRAAIRRATTLAAAWLTLAAPLLAAPAEEPVEEKTYVPCYLIIFFAVGLGLMMICRAGKRTVEFRRPD